MTMLQFVRLALVVLCMYPVCSMWADSVPACAPCCDNPDPCCCPFGALCHVPADLQCGSGLDCTDKYGNPVPCPDGNGGDHGCECPSDAVCTDLRCYPVPDVCSDKYGNPVTCSPCTTNATASSSSSSNCPASCAGGCPPPCEKKSCSAACKGQPPDDSDGCRDFVVTREPPLIVYHPKMTTNPSWSAAQWAQQLGLSAVGVDGDLYKNIHYKRNENCEWVERDPTPNPANCFYQANNADSWVKVGDPVHIMWHGSVDVSQNVPDGAAFGSLDVYLYNPPAETDCPKTVTEVKKRTTHLVRGSGCSGTTVVEGVEYPCLPMLLEASCSKQPLKACNNPPKTVSEDVYGCCPDNDNANCEFSYQYADLKKGTVVLLSTPGSKCGANVLAPCSKVYRCNLVFAGQARWCQQTELKDGLASKFVACN